MVTSFFHVLLEPGAIDNHSHLAKKILNKTLKNCEPKKKNGPV